MPDGLDLLTHPDHVVSMVVSAVLQGVALGAGMLAITLVYRRR